MTGLVGHRVVSAGESSCVCVCVCVCVCESVANALEEESASNEALVIMVNGAKVGTPKAFSRMSLVV